jgi:hypothetical protein
MALGWGAARAISALCGAAKALKTTAPIILRLSNAGKLRIIAPPTGPKRGYRAVCKDDVERLKAERATLLPEAESAAVLGVSVFRLRQLRRAGFIETEDSEMFPQDPRYDASKLVKFVKGLSSHSVASTVSYRPVTDKSTSLIDTIRLVLTGELKAFWGPAESRAISNLYVSLADARRFRAGHWEAWSDPDYVTAGFAMLTLGTNMLAIKDLARRGHLVSHGETRDGKLRSVTRGSFEEFDRTYISSRKIAIAHSLTTATVTRRIAAQGVTPAVPGVRSLKTACFWLREDLGTVDIYAPERAPAATSLDFDPHFQSISSAGRELLLNRESLQSLHRAGFFGSNSSNQRVLEVTSIENFRQRYVSGSEIACLYGLSPKAVATRMRDLGFVPIYKSAEGNFVQLCWRREDASSIDWRERWLRTSRQQGALSSKHHLTKLMSLRPEQRSSTEEVTLDDAVALLGTKADALTQAARTGYLAVPRRTCTGKIIAFDASSVREFDARFVFNGHVAARLNVLPRTVYARMRAKGIVPAIPPRHGVEGAWHRADIESLETLMPLVDQSF